MEKDEAPASASPRDEKSPTPDGDGNPVTRLFKDVGTKVRNVVAFVERVETEVLDDKTVDDKVKALQHTRNVKTLRQMWIDLILSKEFTTIIDQVFDRCCNLNDDDDDDDGTDGEGKLDRTELGAAMKMLWERLDQKTGGGRKLPRIKESEETVLRRYDADSDGHLDRDEFHGFAKTYFSRMEWPAWKVAAKGATKGPGVLSRAARASPAHDRGGQGDGGSHRQGQDTEGAGERRGGRVEGVAEEGQVRSQEATRGDEGKGG